MKLEEALKQKKPKQYLSRKKWKGKNILLMTSQISVEHLSKSINLTQESLNADDWDLYELLSEE